MRILLVEDHLDSAAALLRLLARAGHETTHAPSLEVARALCSQHKFDLLISDLHLPDGSGWDLLGELRRLCDTPAIALTAAGTDSHRQRSVDAGFAGYVTKPFEIQELLTLINRLAPPSLAK